MITHLRPCSTEKGTAQYLGKAGIKLSRILVVDDDKAFCQYIATMLSNHGHEVGLAFDGLEGVKAFKHHQFDLVLVDIFMPEMEGIETIKELRKLGKLVPIVAVSGGTSSCSCVDYLEISKKFGAFRTLQKPVGIHELMSVVRECLYLNSRSPH